MSIPAAKPSHISNYAEITLRALVKHNLGHCISLGGAFGLLHYLDYRPTYDVDAWWEPDLTTLQQEHVIHVIETTLQPFGTIRRRVWGEVVSIELATDDKKVFSFQIAQRSAQLQPSEVAEWIDLPIDSFADLVSSKMVALVERGAPRDFRDIYAVCHAALTTPVECWRWWQQRQQLANSDVDFWRARLAIETHLERITQHRPLAKITDTQQRQNAQQIRVWFREVFIHAVPD